MGKPRFHDNDTQSCYAQYTINTQQIYNKCTTNAQTHDKTRESFCGAHRYPFEISITIILSILIFVLCTFVFILNIFERAEILGRAKFIQNYLAISRHFYCFSRLLLQGYIEFYRPLNTSMFHVGQ